ncbi:MAG: Holliday junction resolvase RuvX [Bacteroidaceae bacterium]|nr:Holliday junction resolvase RuvX [Bacteroidaceae bacterium]
MSRVLAIDYGVRRTGIAVTDPLQLIANGLTTVESRQLLDFLKDYVAREPVELFLVGKPMQTNGRESENLANVRKFVEKLQQALPHIPVEWWDERYTSVLAHQTMLYGGVKKMARRNKALVDEISATIILQGWMERRKP